MHVHVEVFAFAVGEHALVGPHIQRQVVDERGADVKPGYADHQEQTESTHLHLWEQTLESDRRPPVVAPGMQQLKQLQPHAQRMGS